MRVGRVEGNWILNPTFQQLEFSTIDLVVSGTNDSVVMVEGGALEISEAEVVEALKVAQRGIRDLIKLEQQLIGKAGAAKKMAWTKLEADKALVTRVREAAEQAIGQAINAKDKAGRAEAIRTVKQQVLEKLGPDFADQARAIGTELEEIEYRVMRKQVLDKGERVDGRDLDTIRPIWFETSVLKPLAPTAPRCSPGARPRRSCRSRWVPRTTNSGSTASTWPVRRPSRSCSTTTSRPSASAKVKS